MTGSANFKDDFAAKGGVKLWGGSVAGSISRGSNRLNCPTFNLTTADVGKRCLVNRIGPGGGMDDDVIVGLDNLQGGVYLQAILQNGNQDPNNDYSGLNINLVPQDDAPAWNTAISQIRGTGAKLLVPPDVYACSTMNFSKIIGERVEGLGWGADNQGFPGSLGSTFIPISPSGPLLDARGSQEYQLNFLEFGHQWQAQTPPIPILTEPTSDGAPSAGWRWDNLTFAGPWAAAMANFYGVITAKISNCSFGQNRPGSISIVAGQDNLYPVTSPFSTGATGFQNCGQIHFEDGGCSVAPGVGSVPTFYLRGTGGVTARNFTFVGSQGPACGVVQGARVNGVDPSLALYEECNIYPDGTGGPPAFSVWAEAGCTFSIQYEPFDGGGLGGAWGGPGTVSWTKL